MENKTMYRILVGAIFVLLMVVGIYLGMEFYEKDEVEKIIESNTEPVEIYIDEENEEEQDELEEKLTDVDVKFVDVYPDCGHTIENIEHQENALKKDIMMYIEEKDIGYKLLREEEGLIIYEKVHLGKCRNHYKVMLENDVVVIYRIGESGDYEEYQITEITKETVREGISEQLEEGIEVDELEELLLLIEDIES